MVKLAIALVFLSFAGTFASHSEGDERIVGGINAYPGQFPHQISMQSNGQHFCGGSIISANKILTAAHCVYGNNQPMDVVAGIDNLGNQGQRVAVAKAIYHSDYSPNQIVNDVAVLILRVPLVFNKFVQPIQMAISNPPYGASLTLSGWGLTSYPGSIPSQLQTINLDNLNLQQCAQQMQEAGVPNPITTGHVCTTSNPGYGACQGDSGGPLIYNGAQVGIVSWGVPCAKGRPDIFTSVAFYYNWIQNTN